MTGPSWSDARLRLETLRRLEARQNSARARLVTVTQNKLRQRAVQQHLQQLMLRSTRLRCAIQRSGQAGEGVGRLEGAGGWEAAEPAGVPHLSRVQSGAASAELHSLPGGEPEGDEAGGGARVRAAGQAWGGHRASHSLHHPPRHPDKESAPTRHRQ